MQVSHFEIVMEGLRGNTLSRLGLVVSMAKMIFRVDCLVSTNNATPLQLAKLFG